jgi:hypothetical protein
MSALMSASMANAMQHAIAWVPFLEPWPAAPRLWWLLILPLALFLSMAWKAVRIPDMNRYWISVGAMTGQIVIGVIGIAVALYLLVIVLMPRLPAE